MSPVRQRKSRIQFVGENKDIFSSSERVWLIKGIVLSHVIEVEKKLKNKINEEGKSDEDLSLLEILLLTKGLTRKDVVTFMQDMFFAGIDTLISEER
ncbi:hypothetical protein Anas_04699 [Armadillidium nasatum]|uniref:Uncharacterized protein n=1 Tax=Armadillidium nasatum TaxID=96803 RepID=A0A5N5SSI6_9CRUS|nr:hypothetical protein Anas_04699 [Armadillidium nasatum]